MIRILIILFSLTFFADCTLAQDVQPTGKSFFTISYFSEKVLHLGLQLSVNRSLYISSDIENQKNRFDIGFSTGVYFHPKNHIGLRLTPHFSFIHANKKGFEYGIKADAGFMRRFYQGKVFEVDDNGNIKQKYLSGQNAFTYGAYIILAKNWYSGKSKNIRLFLEFGGFQETNYNESTLLHPAINVGMSKYFNLKK